MFDTRMHNMFNTRMYVLVGFNIFYKLVQQGAIAVTSQDAPVRWRLYSEFALRGVRVVLIENIV